MAVFAQFMEEEEEELVNYNLVTGVVYDSNCKKSCHKHCHSTMRNHCCNEKRMKSFGEKVAQVYGDFVISISHCTCIIGLLPMQATNLGKEKVSFKNIMVHVDQVQTLVQLWEEGYSAETLNRVHDRKLR